MRSPVIDLVRRHVHIIGYYLLIFYTPNIKTLFLVALGDVESYNAQSSKVYPLTGERHFAMKPIVNKDVLQQVYSIIS